MTRKQLEALAQRCEQATGPDTKLDDAIWLAENEAGRGNAQGGWQYDIKQEPPYTASVDAALTLVPEGFNRSIHAVVGKPVSARLWDDSCDILVVHAKTEALAITAAALRARAA